MRRSPTLLVLSLLWIGTGPAWGQDNYEIQVYGSELVEPGKTMFELHSNYAVQGSRRTVDGVLPSYHALHETLEITHGWTDFFETGFYQFTTLQADGTYNWVGTHIRPRFSIPERLEWPVGLSLSTEIGYQRPQFSTDTWTLEIRPIIDKHFDRWYLAFNPTIDISLAGQNKKRGAMFSPNFKISYDVSPQVALGVEYYGSLGPFAGFDPGPMQQHQICPAVDLNIDPEWEMNFGVCFGLTPATDHLIPKLILGRRFDF